VGDYGHVAFGQKFPGEKGSFHDATASSLVAKVQGEVCAHFYIVATKCHSSMFGLPEQILCEHSPHIKESDEYALDLALPLPVLPFLGLSEFGLTVYYSCFLSRMLV
jgi:hypothetical protein